MNEISLAIWDELYGLADRVRALAPWTWMEETDIFGVAMPDGETVFVSVMGALGEHLSVAVYSEAALDALTSFIDETKDPARLLEIPHIQLTFDSRQETLAEERALIARLGRKYRGKQAWPLFRSYRPGYYPWFLETNEAETLRVVLPQLLDVAPRLRSNPALTRHAERDVFLTRTPDASIPEGWKDDLRRVPPQPSTLPRPVLDAQTASRYQALTQTAASLEMDFFPLGVRVGASGERPALPYCLLLVESGSGLIISHNLMSVRSTMQDLLGEIPLRTLDALGRYGARPATLTVRHGRLAPLMRSSCEALGIQLRTRRELPYLDPARESLSAFMGR